MKKINLLFIVTKLELGGAQKQLLSLIRHLDKDKFNLFLFISSQGLLDRQAQVISGLTLYKSKYLGRAINPLKDLLAIFEILSFIKNNQSRVQDVLRRFGYFMEGRALWMERLLHSGSNSVSY